ncbi:terpene synthase [Suillus bovinus]|uniref:terpene synthase n=1 Tax=Suillus bovinus TaxID=48563 RepID=UPI001B87C2F6|nr:terpene synthase [Suillus bovinus]KAG2151672.1 terpene synthase [Suillus bovinus]
MASNAICTISMSEPTQFILPDFFISRASAQWLCSEAHLVEPETAKYTMILRPGYLASACYPDADAFRLKVCTDFLGWSFKMDDWLKIDRLDVNDAWGVRDCCMSAFRDPVNFQTEQYSGKVCKSFFSRFKEGGGPGRTERLIHGMDLWFISAAKEMDNRAKGHVHNVDSYIELRRDSSGCMACFAFIEFSCQIDLPNEVVSHPVIMALEQAANDTVSWSNDILSYNREQSHRSTHNLVAVLMVDQGLDLQGAIDYCDRLCNVSLQRFKDNRAIIPSWGEEVDKQVAIYVQGLQDWIAGSLQWSFESARYFGKDRHIVKRDRIVKLLPK